MALQAKTFRGLDKKRMRQKPGKGSGPRIKVQDDIPNTVQFLVNPDQFTEFEQHSWQSGGRWFYVPCAGEGCPKCADEDDKIRKVNYRFAAPVYDFKEKRTAILEGPQTMASVIFRRFEAKERIRPGLFRRLVWNVTRFSGTPTTFDCEESEHKAKNPASLGEKPDTEKYVQSNLEYYYERADADVSSLDDDFDGEDWEEDEDWLDEGSDEKWDEGSLLALNRSQLIEVAAEFNIRAMSDKVTKENRPKLIAAILRKQG